MHTKQFDPELIQDQDIARRLRGLANLFDPLDRTVVKAATLDVDARMQLASTLREAAMQIGEPVETDFYIIDEEANDRFDGSKIDPSSEVHQSFVEDVNPEPKQITKGPVPGLEQW